MYKCTDCGEEYNIKPDYCDCGNNIFENIKVIKEIEEPALIEATAATGIMPPREMQAKKPLDTASWLIFISCIILSVLSIIFIANETPDKSAKTQTHPGYSKKTKTAKEIPSINKLWTETKIDTQTAPAVVESKIAPNPVILPATLPAPMSVAKTVSKKVLPKKIQAPKLLKPPAPVVVNPIPARLNSVAAQQEFMKYKIALRNRIASDINFAAVVGDGECLISFKLDSSGNLINRAFVKQSDNDSLNDAVYAGIMQNPTFKAPPNAYKRESLKLSVKMHGGSYEVTLY